MNVKPVIGKAAMSCAAMCLAMYLAGSAHAQVQMVLQGHLVGQRNMDGKVQYVVHNKRVRSLQAIVLGANPGQAYGVAARRGRDRVMLGFAQANRRGIATMELQTIAGHQIPPLQVGDTVEIWTNRDVILSGQLE